jgi:ribosomal-protein-alanine N-acetyltransferase
MPFSSAMIGYKFDKNHHGYGYATEAVTCAIHNFFHDSDIHRLTAFVLPDNNKSVELLERIGFEYEGICRKSICICGEYKDHLQYSIIKD